MLDRLIRRYTSRAFAVPATASGIHAQSLALAGFALGFAAVPFLAHSAYLVGLALIVASRLLGLLAFSLERRTPRTANEDVLERVLELIWSASLPFAFALAEPERALAAMFLMLGLVARAAALSADRRTPQGSVGAAADFGRELVGESDLSIVYALLCLFPHWFSIAAYALGIACFVMTGFRIATFGSQRS